MGYTGKSLNTPVHQLLGGAVRDRVQVYAHTGGGTLEELCIRSKELVRKGFRVLKTGFDPPVAYIENKNFVDSCVDRFAALRIPLVLMWI